jgi:hypothetical protein
VAELWRATERFPPLGVRAYPIGILQFPASAKRLEKLHDDRAPVEFSCRDSPTSDTG